MIEDGTRFRHRVEYKAAGRIEETVEDDLAIRWRRREERPAYCGAADGHVVSSSFQLLQSQE